MKKHVKKLPICQKHNQPIVFHEIDQLIGAFCAICVQEKKNLSFDDAYQQQQGDNINKLNKQNQNEKQQLQNIYDSILNYKNNLIISLDKILTVIQDQIKINELFQQKLLYQNQQANNQQQLMQNLEIEFKNQQLDIDQIKINVRQLLQDFSKKYFNLDKYFLLLNEKRNIFIEDFTMDQKKINYELMKESSKEQPGNCYAFAFNKENNILVVGCRFEIILYRFINGKITKQLQRLTAHTNWVNCFYFMKQQNSFVSGSSDNSVIIWEFDEDKNSWFAKTQLKDHDQSIVCVLMNKNEDLLISGYYFTLKFWIKENNSWNYSQKIDTMNYVHGISINELGNKLISCGENAPISIMEAGTDKIWRIVQILKPKQYGFRICFTTKDQFVFQPYDCDYTEVYEYDKVKKQFEKFQQVQIDYQKDGCLYFPCQYIEQLKIIAIKLGQNINIFKINYDRNYQLIQTIELNYSGLQGRLTDDGQYLVTWDQESKLIQVRQLKYQE